MLNGSTTASDIWSVGCLAIELYTGNPPYSSLEPMAAMFKIASDDDYFPYPADISKEFLYFLTSCFQRDQNLRISARRLINHSFITGKFFEDTSFHGNVSSSKKQISISKYREDAIADDDYSADFEIIGDNALSLQMTMQQEPVISDDEEDNQQLNNVLSEPSKLLNQSNIFNFANSIQHISHDSVRLRDFITSLNDQADGYLDFKVLALWKLKTENINDTAGVEILCFVVSKLPAFTFHVFRDRIEDLLSHSSPLELKILLINRLRNTLDDKVFSLHRVFIKFNLSNNVFLHHSLATQTLN